MDITYLGHSCFKIKTKSGVVVTDPYDKSVGLTMSSVSADLVTISHRGHGDHDEAKAISGTSRRTAPFVIDAPGEYEVEGISVFGYGTFHDNKKGAERGENTIYVIQAEDLRVLHLGDLGHELDAALMDTLDGIDVLLIPVGGVYTIGPKEAAELAKKFEPSYVIPMHYKTDKHNMESFGEMAEANKFVTEMGLSARVVETLSLNKATMSAETTELIMFE